MTRVPLSDIYDNTKRDNIFSALQVNQYAGTMFLLYHEASILDLSNILPNIAQQSTGCNLMREHTLLHIQDGVRQMRRINTVPFLPYDGAFRLKTMSSEFCG